ncbi:MAG: polysaccharide deacetylase family protein [Planctomycetota bacterium]
MNLFPLLFHGISGSSREEAGFRPEERFYVTSREKFQGLADWISRRGYRVLTAADLLGDEERPDITQATILTFDDALPSHHRHALPVLAERKLHGMFFLVTDDVGKPDRLGWGDVRDLDHAGMTIGTHGRTHRLFSHLGARELREELRSSKRELEDRLGKEVHLCALPGGAWHPDTAAAARESGYRGLLMSGVRRHVIDSVPKIWYRFTVVRKTPLDDMEGFLLGRKVIRFRYRARAAAVALIKGVLGRKWYRTLKGSYG